MSTREIPAISEQQVKAVLEEVEKLMNANAYYKRRKRIKFDEFKFALEEQLKPYAHYNNIPLHLVVSTIITSMEKYHGRASLPREVILEEIEFELNNFHHNKNIL